MKKSRKFIGLDLSVAKTGIAILTVSSKSIISAKTFSVKSKPRASYSDDIARVSSIWKEIRRTIGQTSSILAIGIEPAINVKWSRGSSMKLIELNMVVRYEFWKLKKSLVSMPAKLCR